MALAFEHSRFTSPKSAASGSVFAMLLPPPMPAASHEKPVVVSTARSWAPAVTTAVRRSASSVMPTGLTPRVAAVVTTPAKVTLRTAWFSRSATNMCAAALSVATANTWSKRAAPPVSSTLPLTAVAEPARLVTTAPDDTWRTRLPKRSATK
jgi:hypothetical protein